MHHIIPPVLRHQINRVLWYLIFNTLINISSKVISKQLILNAVFVLMLEIYFFVYLTAINQLTHK